MQVISNSYGAFSEEFDAEGQHGLVTVHPEMHPGPQGIAPTGRYHVFGVHPVHGTFLLLLDETETGEWFSTLQVPFVSPEFISWLGARIDNYYK